MLVSYYTDSFELLILGRFVIGLNAGLNSGTPPMYLTEIAPAELRGAIGTLSAVICIVGVFVAQLLGLDFILGSPRGWRFLFGFSLVPAVIQLATLPCCPESPRYLYLNRHQVAHATKALAFFQSPSAVMKELKQMEEEYETTKDRPRVTIVGLFRDPFLRRIILICIMAMLSQQFSGTVFQIFLFSVALSILFKKTSKILVKLLPKQPQRLKVSMRCFPGTMLAWKSTNKSIPTYFRISHKSVRAA